MDMTAVRQAFRAALEARGYRIASDSHGITNELYIVGDSDLALALFDIQPTAEEAFWTKSTDLDGALSRRLGA